MNYFAIKHLRKVFINFLAGNMKFLTWVSGFLAASYKFLKCPKRQFSQPEKKAKKIVLKQKKSKKRKNPKKKTLFGHDLINQPFNYPFPVSSQALDLNGVTEKTFLIHERMSLNFKKVCLNGSGLIYDSSIFRVVFRFRLKKDQKTIKTQFSVSNISEHTEISFLELNFRPNPGF